MNKKFERFTNLFKKLTIEPKDLSGKFALVTGGNEGIGLQTAIFLAKWNAHVIIASRNEAKTIQAVEEIKRRSKNQNVDYQLVDLASLESVKEFTKSFVEKHSRLDILINNAGGVFHQYSETTDGIERNVQINHLGPLVLTLGLLPSIKAADNARVVFVSSAAHYDPPLFLPEDLHPKCDDREGMTTYAKSKLMNVLVAKELARKLTSKNIIVTSLHPGLVATNIIYEHLPNTWRGYFTGLVIRVFYAILARDTEQGAITSVYAATADDVVSGEYYDSLKPGLLNPLANDEHLTKDLWEQSLQLAQFDHTCIYD